ncbi:MAG: hypothetical protein WCO00_15925 [Rhodospirillaceae bacterium]
MTTTATSVGTRLRVDLECLTTPSGVVVGNLRAAGQMITSERRTIAEAMTAAGRLAGQFMVFDATETLLVDHYAVGKILMLNGRLRLTNRHFSLVVGEGAVADYLRRYGVLEIIKARPLGRVETAGLGIAAAARLSRSRRLDSGVRAEAAPRPWHQPAGGSAASR